MEPFETDEIDDAPARRRTPRWPFVVVVISLLIGLGVVLLWPLKLPYYAIYPGPVEEVHDLITIQDVETYHPSGDLFLLTVGLREVNAFEYVEAEFDGKVDLIGRDVIRPPGVTQEEVARTNMEAMDESIDTAVYVALKRLGYQVSFTGDGVKVLQTVEGSPAQGALQVGDLITKIAGKPVVTTDDAAAVIRSFKVGDTITLEGTRNEQPLSVSITLVEHPDLAGQPMVGVVFETVNLKLVLPIDLKVDSRNIGGPSAGMMYAITVLDLLSPDDLTRGHRIAGTGTIRFDETVGAIGGVRQKVFAARSIGAEYVLVPKDNYEDAVTAAGDGIKVVSVSTLQDALDFLATLQPVSPVVTASG
jgi:PDZ domain-containing protein